MSICALTGGFLCGKSTALELFEKRGVKVFDLDSIYHQLLKSSSPMQKTLQRELAIEDIVDTDIIKAALKDSRIDMQRLSDLTHPFIISELKTLIAKLRHQEDKILVLVEVPLLYECELDSLFDKVIVVAVGKTVLESRARERSYDSEQLNMILQSQLDIAEKVKRADIVIENNGSLNDLDKEISKVYNHLDIMQKEA